MKQKVCKWSRFLLPALVLLCGLALPALAAGGPQDGARAVRVTTFAQLKAELEREENTEITVQEDITHVLEGGELRPGWTEGEESGSFAIIIPSGYEKTLILDADLRLSDTAEAVCRDLRGVILNSRSSILRLRGGGDLAYTRTAAHPFGNNSLITNEGWLDVDLEGTVYVRSEVGSAGSQGPAPFAILHDIRTSNGYLEVSRGSIIGEGKDGSTVTPIVSDYGTGMVKLSGGRFYSNSGPAVMTDSDLMVFGGSFASGTGRVQSAEDCALWAQAKDTSLIILYGGTFQGIYGGRDNFDVRSLLDDETEAEFYADGEPYTGPTLGGLFHTVRVDERKDWLLRIGEAALSGVKPLKAGQVPDLSLTLPPYAAYELVSHQLELDGKPLTGAPRAGEWYMRVIRLASKPRYLFREPCTVTVDGRSIQHPNFTTGEGGFSLTIHWAEQCPEGLPFVDVPEQSWYYVPVRYVFERGLMTGSAPGRFLPEVRLTRAQLAQILYNRAGRPQTGTDSGFGDVDPEAWFCPAVTWAAGAGYMSGYGAGRFGPEDLLTREQLAAILFRYSGADTVSGDLEGFRDRDRISGYARNAMCWAVERGIISGKGGGILDPLGSTTRAEVAAMLRGYLEPLG